jgi:isochorismate hydrolase
MKERYLTSENIHTYPMFRDPVIDKLRNQHPLPNRFIRPALLLIDMQRYFIDSEYRAYIPSAQAIVPVLADLQHTCCAHAVPIIQTQHINDLSNANQMEHWWKELITESHPGVAIHPKIEHTQAIRVVKTQYDAFWESRLPEILIHNNIHDLLIGGVMTHLCCETTARAAFVRGYRCFFICNGTATYTEAHHRSSMLNLAHGCCYILSVAEAVGLIQRGGT